MKIPQNFTQPLDPSPMARYQSLDTGESLKADDPKRGVWYSTRCTFWTDDWTRLASNRGIPCCPYCGAVGYQITFQEWDDGAKAYEKQGHPGYVKRLNALKDVQCGPIPDEVTE